MNLLTLKFTSMSYDLPRVIILNSETIPGTSFVCGFVSLQPGNTNGINAGTYYLGENGANPYIMYSEDETVKIEEPVQSLPPYIFSGKGMPPLLDIIFENQAGKKSPKIRVTATMGHPNDDLPNLYMPRVFILSDSMKGEGGSGAVSYGFLIDMYEGDQLKYETSSWQNGTIFSIDTTKEISQNPVTNIFLFPINIQVDSFQINVEHLGIGVLEMNYQGSPEYYTLDQ